MLFEIDVFTSIDVGGEVSQDVFLIPIKVAAQRSFEHVYQWDNNVQTKVVGHIASAAGIQEEVVILLKARVKLPTEEVAEFLAFLNKAQDASFRSYTVLVQSP
ncbi:MAG: hypothetical protein Q7T74_04555 [Candidatus Saccharibacteria bacterium]|nr:hypothetical protein [Candidatus Saccharibacteria bacterium]